MEKSYVAKIREKFPTEKIMLVSGCAIIPNEEGKILLQKRSDSKLWGLPGGLKELNETIEECVVREVLEESNLNVKLTDFIGVYINPSMSWFKTDEAEVIGFCYLGEIVSGDLRVNDSESLEFGYYDLSNLPQIHAIDNYLMIQDYFSGKYGGIEGKFKK